MESKLKTVEAGSRLRPINLHYRETLPTDTSAPDPAPLVFIHGFTGSLATFEEIQAPLTERLHRTGYAIDLPGHGESDMGAPSLSYFTDATRRFLDVLKIPRAHLVGHSMGGLVSLNLACEHPARVASLTALCPSGFGSRGEHAHANAQIYIATRTPENLPTMNHPGMQAFLTRLEDVLDNPKNQHLYQRLPSDPGFPVMAYFGENDPTIPPAEPDTFPAAITVEYGPTGHTPQCEQPERMIDLISRNVGLAIATSPTR